MSLRGYWRTLSERMDCRPAMRMTRLTTTARTGRLTKRSVNFTSVVLGLGCRVVGRPHLVIHVHGGPVAQLEHAGGRHFLARAEAGEDGHLVPAGDPELHYLLPDAPVVKLCLSPPEDRNTHPPNPIPPT